MRSMLRYGLGVAVRGGVAATISLMLLVAGVLYTSGCVPPPPPPPPAPSFLDQEKSMMDSWIGHTKPELLRAWGPPSSVSSDGQGGEILIFNRSMSFPLAPGTAQSDGLGGVLFTLPQNPVVTRSRMFYVNSSGKIYHWLASGRLGP